MLINKKHIVLKINHSILMNINASIEYDTVNNMNPYVGEDSIDSMPVNTRQATITKMT